MEVMLDSRRGGFSVLRSPQLDDEANDIQKPQSPVVAEIYRTPVSKSCVNGKQLECDTHVCKSLHAHVPQHEV